MSKTIRSTDGVIDILGIKIKHGPTVPAGPNGPSAIEIPSGGTSLRPSSPVAGSFRFNTDTGVFEGYNGVQWTTIAQYTLPIFSLSQLATLSPPTATIAYCNNTTGGPEPVFYDGTNWRRFSDRTIID